MSAFDWFTRKVCLTTVSEEWQKAEAEFARVGLTGVQKFQSLPIDGTTIPGPHQSFSASVRRILIEFYESGAETLLHLEDDVSFRDLDHLAGALSELPANWDLAYLGANLVLWGDGNEPQPERFSDHLFRVRAAWTTHAVAFSRRPIEFILENQPGYSDRMFDNAMSDQLPSLNAFIVTPMVAWQRAHFSAIWDRFDDYSDLFERSEAKLV